MSFELGNGDRGVTLAHSPDGYTVVETDYGWDFIGESQITVRVTTRSDGQTAWGAMMSEPDGVIRCRSGISKASEAGWHIKFAITLMMVEAKWLPDHIAKWASEAA